MKQHCGTATHKKMEKVIKSSRSHRSFAASSTSSFEEITIKAEVLHTNFIVQHNLSFLTADHLSQLYSKNVSRFTDCTAVLMLQDKNN